VTERMVYTTSDVLSGLEFWVESGSESYLYNE